VHNHNFCDHSPERSFQNGLQAFAAPVEARPDVRDELVARVGGSEGGNLPLQVLLLFGARDACVGDLGLFGHNCPDSPWFAKHGADVAAVVEALAISIDSLTADAPCICPASQRIGRDSGFLTEHLASEKDALHEELCIDEIVAIVICQICKCVCFTLVAT
jgi:hypothetical protein